MSNRVTTKDLETRIKILGEMLGVAVTYQRWHKHISIWTTKDGSALDYQIASSDTLRDCLDQVNAAINALYVIKKYEKGGK